MGLGAALPLLSPLGSQHWLVGRGLAMALTVSVIDHDVTSLPLGFVEVGWRGLCLVQGHPAREKQDPCVQDAFPMAKTEFWVGL